MTDHLNGNAGKPGQLLTARQVAELMQISERSVWSLTNSGSLAAIRIGRLVRYSPADVQSWIERRRRPAAAPDAPADLGDPPRPA